MKIVAGVAAAIMLTGASQEAPITCPVPELPAVERPVKPTRPVVPACIDEARNRHNCSNRVIGAYNTELTRYGQAFDAYVASVNAYGRKLAAYVESVNAYVQCEQRVVMPTVLIEG